MCAEGHIELLPGGHDASGRKLSRGMELLSMKAADNMQNKSKINWSE